MKAGRLLLLCYPRRFRRAHGDELLRSLREDLADARTAGGLQGVHDAARALSDFVAAGLAERLAPSRSSRVGAVDARRPRVHISSLFIDLRQSARGLAASPGFTLVAIATLALSIGAGATIFSVVNGVVLKPLPYHASDRLVNVWNDLGHGAQSLPAVHPSDFRDYQAWSRLVDEFAAASGGQAVEATGVLTGDGAEPEQVDVSAVTANFFPLLGVEPTLGRPFTAAEESAGGPQAVIVGHGLWRRRYGSDPGLVGRVIDIDGRRHTVVGVLPAGFRLYLPAEAFLVKDAQVWLPLKVDYSRLPPRNFTYFTVFGRLKRGVTADLAQAEMDAIAERLRREHPVHRASNLRIRVVPLQQDVVKAVRPALLILLAAVGLVLLIGCGNIASLLLARSGARRREVAVHAALGASRWRIVRRLLIESLFIAVLGAAAGLGLTRLALIGLAQLEPGGLPRFDEIAVDRTVLAAALIATLATTLLFGLLPAVRASKSDLSTDLKDASRGSGGPAQDRLRRVLVVGQVALSFVLLAGASLLVQSFLALQHVRPGFDADRVLTLQLALPGARYPTSSERRAFLSTLEDRLRTLPGVEVVGATSQLPLTGSGPLSPYAYDEDTARHWESMTADGRNVTPDFFAAIGARLTAGRFFNEQDGVDGRPVIVIDTELARQVWPDGNAVGQRLQVAPNGSDEMYAHVIGVVGHLRIHDLTRPVRPQIWEPLLPGVGRNLSLAVRTSGDPRALAGGVRGAIREIDPNLAISRLRPMSDYVADASEQMRFNASLMLAFGVLATVLAAVGVYGVIAYSVAQRTREFGIRMALGQDTGAVRRMVLRQAVSLGAPALLLGFTGALLTTRVVRVLLYEINPIDPLSLFGIPALLMIVMLGASWAPARRATRVDPMVTLRAE